MDSAIPGIFASTNLSSEQNWQTVVVDAFTRLGYCSNPLLDQSFYQDTTLDLAVLVDGFLINHRALCQELNLPIDSSVACIIGHGFLREEIEFFKKLSGPFSVLLYRARQRYLYAVRDPIGQRPLYFSEQRGQHHIASSIAAVATLAKKPIAINLPYLGEYVLNALSSPDETIVEGVSAIPPGTLIRFSEGQLDCQQYYHIPGPLLQLPPFEDLAESLKTALTSACSSVIDQGSIAISLSGGLDSSAILALCPPTSRPQPFSLTFNFPPADEREYLDAVTSFCQVEPIICDPKTPPADWISAQVSQTYDIPVEPNAWFTQRIREEVREAGFKRLLTGYGSDELTTGFPELLATRHYNPLRQILSHLSQTQLAKPFKRIIPSLRWYPSWVTSRFYRDTDIEARLQANTKPSPDYLGPHQRIVWDMLFSAYPRFFREREHREAMRQGISLVHPFYSLEVFELLFQLPVEIHRVNGLSKSLLRASCSGLLPEKLLQRTCKAEFSFYWLDCLRTLYPHPLTLPHLESLGWFNMQKLNHFLNTTLSIKHDSARKSAGALSLCWNILCAEELLATFNEKGIYMP